MLMTDYNDKINDVLDELERALRLDHPNVTPNRRDRWRKAREQCFDSLVYIQETSHDDCWSDEDHAAACEDRCKDIKDAMQAALDKL